MAVQDWLNSNVVGDLSLGELGSSAIDFYNTYQTNEARQEATDEIVAGYEQGMGTIDELSDQTRGVISDVYGTNMANLEPWQEAGRTGVEGYMGLLQDPSSIMANPGYEFVRGQGEENLARRMAAAGYADPMGSGAYPVGITEYNQDYASGQYDKALDRYGVPAGWGMEANRVGAMVGDSYQRGMTDINKYQGSNLVALYEGRANAESTKAILDSMAMNDYLKGATGLLNQAAGNQGIAELIMSALGGGTTSDGASMWDMLADAFGFDSQDEGTTSQIVDAVTQMMGGGGTDGTGGINWGELGLDIGGTLDLGDVGNIDWGNILQSGAQNFGDLFDGALTDFNWGSISTDIFGDLDLGDIGNIDWDNLFDWGDDANGLAALDGMTWGADGSLVWGGGTGIDALGLGDFDLGGGDSSWYEDAWDWGSGLFR